MPLENKDLITIGISSFALGISLLNFYIQQVRRRDRLIGTLLSVSVREGSYDTVAEYSLSNTGDTQLVVKDAILLGDKDPEFGGQPLLDREVANLPCILKPGEMAVISVSYNRRDIDQFDQAIVEFKVLSSKGKNYQLPHLLQIKGGGHSRSWAIFRLSRKHVPL